MTTPTSEQMKQRWHAWRKAHPEKAPAVMDMIEKGYTLPRIMEALGGSVPATASAASLPPPSSPDDIKAMWKRQTDKINAHNARIRS
jgi:hypothetical protein